MKRYPLAKPSITGKEIRAVTRVLRSGVLSLGKETESFEREFAKKVGMRHACAVSSGTAGLHLAMIAGGIGPGDEVITTPFSFIASSNCILYVGATPVFADIDPVTYNIDPGEIEKKITNKTKAILPVHIFGQSADMAPIMRIARKHKLKVIEDACESLGAAYHGKQVGTFGESAVFAFYPNKQMTTGEGGMIVTNSARIHALSKSLSNQGRGANMQWLDHKYLGYNYRMDEMSAALGRVQLGRLAPLIKGRQHIAAMYNEALAPFHGLVETSKTAAHRTNTLFVYVVRVKKKGITRDRVIARLKDRGISSKPYLPSIHLFDFYRKQFGFKPGDFPISEAVSDASLALPFYIGLTKKDVQTIAGALGDILQNV